jgi:hypothetical protein
MAAVRGREGNAGVVDIYSLGTATAPAAPPTPDASAGSGTGGV